LNVRGSAQLQLFDDKTSLPPLNTPLTIMSHTGGTFSGTFANAANGAIVVSSSGESYQVAYTSTAVTVTHLSGPKFPNRAITTPINEGGAATLMGQITTLQP